MTAIKQKKPQAGTPVARVVFTIETEVKPSDREWEWLLLHMTITVKEEPADPSPFIVELGRKMVTLADAVALTSKRKAGRPDKYMALPAIIDQAQKSGKTETEIISTVAKAFRISRSAARQALYRYRVRHRDGRQKEGEQE